MPDKDAIRIKQWQDELINRVAVALAERQAKLTWLPEVPENEDEEDSKDPAPGDPEFVRKPVRPGFGTRQQESSNAPGLVSHGKIQPSSSEFSTSGTSLAQLGEQMLGKKGMKQLGKRKQLGALRDGQKNSAKRHAAPESDSEEEPGRAAAVTSTKRKAKAQGADIPNRKALQESAVQNAGTNGQERKQDHDRTSLNKTAPPQLSSPNEADFMDVDVESVPTCQAKHETERNAAGRQPPAKSFLDEVIAGRSKKKKRKRKKRENEKKM